ncbi:hypothetical protein AB0D98_30690 [Streptomyces sp. NPDC047987]|uniref:hypothetical protein n=1 Tax=unclassified Streptomyces TaxID=2593676 RepID=UPI00343EAB9F
MHGELREHISRACRIPHWAASAACGRVGCRWSGDWQASGYVGGAAYADGVSGYAAPEWDGLLVEARELPPYFGSRLNNDVDQT